MKNKFFVGDTVRLLEIPKKMYTISSVTETELGYIYTVEELGKIILHENKLVRLV